MQQRTPKSLLSTQKTKISFGTPSCYDLDIQLEKEYLQKLKNQRVKAEKLYNEYKAVVRDRDVLTADKQQLSRELQELRRKHEREHEDNRTQYFRLKTSYEHLLAQHNTLKTSQSEQYAYKLSYEQKINELESQIRIYQQDRYSRTDMIDYLEEEVSRLQSEKDNIYEESEREAAVIRDKILKVEGMYQRVSKQLSRQRQGGSKMRSQWEVEKEKIVKSLSHKTEQARKMKLDFDSEINNKDRLYQILASQFQETKMYWSVKIDEKSKQIQSQRKTVDHLKQQTRKLKSQMYVLRERVREKDSQQGDRRNVLNELSANLTRKQQQCLQLKQQSRRCLEERSHLQLRVRQLQINLGKNEQSAKRLQQICDEYLKIIQKMQQSQNQRLVIVQTQYKQIDRMERIFDRLE